MTKDEELQALREENRILKALVAELLPLKEQLAMATARIKELEDRLGQTSRTSSKPPSSSLPDRKSVREKTKVTIRQSKSATHLWSGGMASNWPFVVLLYVIAVSLPDWLA